MAEDKAVYDKAVKVIGGHKAQITRARVTLDRVVAEGSVAANDLSTVKSAKTMVDKQSAKIQDQIDNLLGNEHFKDDTLDTLTDYLLDTGNLVEKVNSIINADSVKSVDTSVLDMSGIGEALSESLIQAHIKQPLPPIEIPQFNGQHSEFTPFWESFDYLVHNNENYPEVIKATYLQRAMKPNTPAYDLLKHFSPTATNYKLMREKLEKRYKLGYLTKSIYINNLKKVSTWKPCTTSSDLRKLLDYINENLELLKLSGGSSMDDSDFLLTDVLALIPKFVVNSFLDLPERDRNFKALLGKMETSVEKMAERDVLLPKPVRQTQSHTTNPAPRNYNNSNKQNSFTYSVSEHEQCFFCGKQHSAYNCNTKTVHDRLEIAKQRRICHNCLYGGHFSSDCKRASFCNCGRNNAHCKALCFGVSKGTSQSNQQVPSGKSQSNIKRGNSHVALNPDISAAAVADSECFFETVIGYVESADGGSFERLRFMLDSASNTTYGREEKVQRLKYMKVLERDISVDTFGGNEVNVPKSDFIRILVHDAKDYYPPTEICVSVADFVCRDVPTWQLTSFQEHSIRNYVLSDQDQVSGNRAPIDILVGLDNYWKLVHRRTDDPGFGPMLRSSKLGWFLSGQRDFANPRLLTSTSKNPLTHCVQTLFINTVNVSDIQSEKLSSESVCFAHKAPQTEPSDEEEYNAMFSDLETFGIKPEQEVSPILADFVKSIQFNKETNRFKVKLPIIPKFLPKLENGYQVSKVRLDSLFSKMRNPAHSEFTKKYKAIIKEQEDIGVIERVTDTSQGTNACYIPHHGVLKGEKLRIVCDGSYKTSPDKVNLNECLSPGPSLTNELIEMLMRFRIPDVVVTGDIEKAYHQIEVDEAERDYLRFLWYDDNGELVVYRFTRVPFGLTSSAFLLNATLRYHMETKCREEGNSDLLALLGKSHYVDDWIVGAKTPEEALRIKGWLADFLGVIGMKLHKFNSNSPMVRQSIDKDCPELDSILGLPWNSSKDEIAVNIERALQGISEVATKKELYSAPPRVFDPLGFLQPFMFYAKLLFQETCKLNLKWKDPLPTDIRVKFDQWRAQLFKLTEIKLPRQVLLPHFDVLELHGFGDASKLGYCASVYMVSRNSSAAISRLAVSKTRVAPLKEMTIPRLELTAAFLLARLMALVIKFHDQLNFSKVVYYSDSTTALHWIHSDHKLWTTYVANRSRDINLLSSRDNWKYVRTDLNPADLGTRGLSADALVGNDFWFQGPDFLTNNRSASDIDSDSPDLTKPTADSLRERRKIVNVVIEKVPSLEQILPRRKNGMARRLTDYSNLDQVFNITGHLYKFLSLKLEKVAGGFTRWLGYDSAQESFAMIAERSWVRAIQHDYFEDELKFCKDSPKKIPSGMKVVSSKIQQLGLFLDDCGVLRVNTLLKHADVPGLAQEPMLLPKRSHFTSLIVWRAHTRLKHAGVAQTLAELRQMYWIPQGRQVVRNILRQCVKCRMMLAAPYPILASPQLPDFRVQRVEVFSKTGVDFAGPLSISTVSGIQRKRKPKKNQPKKKVESPERMVYLVVFTCAVSRNVHSEVLDGMTVDDLMHGIRRFVSRYGPPTLFYSDNALTFKCVSKELTQVFNHPSLQKYLNDRKITWKFYVQKAPWMGGFIERVVGLYKSAISRVVGRARLDYQEFITLVCELNGMLNSRPISYVYDTVGEEEPITPSRLWCGKNITMFPPFYEARIEGRDPQICSKRLKYLDKVLTHFWKRFSTQYISSLSERHLARNLPRDGRQPKVGEVVLVKNDMLPRGRWKIARVSKLTPGPDGVVRRVELKLPPSDKKNSPDELNRPPRLLVPLECEVDREV